MLEKKGTRVKTSSRIGKATGNLYADAREWPAAKKSSLKKKIRAVAKTGRDPVLGWKQAGLPSGGHSAVEPPGPIPNPEVKHCSADGSWTIGSVRVGRRQVYARLLLKGVGHFFCPRGRIGDRRTGGGRISRIGLIRKRSPKHRRYEFAGVCS